jgi:hypothetical protein
MHFSSFLGDPYHAYYQYKVIEIRDGKPVPDAPTTPAAIVKTSKFVFVDISFDNQRELCRLK